MGIVYVDVSAKVEQWNRDSAVVASNDSLRILLVPGRVKQSLRAHLLRSNKRKTAHFRIFALLIFLSVKDDLDSTSQIVVDQDYSGHSAEGQIKNLLLALIRTIRPGTTGGFIRFANVKGHPADVFARQVFIRKRQPDRVVTYEELLGVLEK